MQRRFWQQPRYVFSAIATLGILAVLVWGVYASQWISLVIVVMSAVLKGCLDALAVVKGYPPLAGIIVLAVLLAAGLMYSSVRLAVKVDADRILTDAGRHALAAERVRNGKLTEALARIKPLAGTPPLHVIRTEKPLCLVQGLTRPRIILSTAVIRDLSEEELETALLHEIHHLNSRDPLKRALAAFVADFLFFIPLVRDVVRHLHHTQELAADGYAGRVSGRPYHLASALVKLASGAYLGTGSFLGRESLPERVASLLGRPYERRRRLRVFSVMFSVVFLLSLFVTPFAFGSDAAVARNADPCVKLCIKAGQQGIADCLKFCGHVDHRR